MVDKGNTMNILWAPWRMEYIKSMEKGEKSCVFCKVAMERRDERNYILHRSRHSFIILNRFPYNTGHLMVVTYKHVPYPTMLTDEELLDVSKTINLAIRILENEYNPEGFNIGVNLGRVGGAGVEEHFHVHIVPRWCGDTNFMPVISATKVMPESLERTYQRLRNSLKKVLGKEGGDD